MKERWHIFFQHYYECPEHRVFDTKEQLEEFLASTDWDNAEGAVIWAMVRGVELDKQPKQKVKTWNVFEKREVKDDKTNPS